MDFIGTDAVTTALVVVLVALAGILFALKLCIDKLAEARETKAEIMTLLSQIGEKHLEQKED